MRKGDPSISLFRLADIYEKLISVRREYQFIADAQDFFRMTDFWEWLCDGDGGFAINRFNSSRAEPPMKAAVVAFDHKVTLTIHDQIWSQASEGCRQSNFVLAHEFAHLALEHHARQAVSKNFMLYSGPNGNCNRPPTIEELEANYAAVIFQCGAGLANPAWPPLDLAKRALSDISLVKKLAPIVRSDHFRLILDRRRSERLRQQSHPRVIL